MSPVLTVFPLLLCARSTTRAALLRARPRPACSHSLSILSSCCMLRRVLSPSCHRSLVPWQACLRLTWVRRPVSLPGSVTPLTRRTVCVRPPLAVCCVCDVSLSVCVSVCVCAQPWSDMCLCWKFNGAVARFRDELSGSSREGQDASPARGPLSSLNVLYFLHFENRMQEQREKPYTLHYTLKCCICPFSRCRSLSCYTIAAIPLHPE